MTLQWMMDDFIMNHRIFIHPFTLTVGRRASTLGSHVDEAMSSVYTNLNMFNLNKIIVLKCLIFLLTKLGLCDGTTVHL